ncbi:hypothetical protein [Pseudomonas sp. TWI929]|uniref:hypothetical protein n=1 Tax=Pseudomonas sp. TWI929 TaxID=3136795 RepID=UPI00320A04E9
MAISSTVSSKAQTRQAFEQARVERLAMMDADVLPPRVNSVIDPNDGTLIKTAVDNDLPVEVEKWRDAYEGDGVQLQLLIDGNWVNVGERETIDGTTPFPLTLLLPKSYMAADATLELRYELFVDNPPYESPAITLRVDRTPPWGTSTPAPLIIADVAVTDDYLDANPQGLEIELPAYPGQKGNDKVAVFYLNHLPDDPADLPDPVLYVAVPADRKLFIPPTVIKQVGNGGCYAVYILWDIAGNESRLGIYKNVTAALGKLPAGLGDPVVPQAAGDNTIDLEDARRGVIVQIPAFENGEHTDTFVVQWGDQVFEHPVVGPLPYQLPVPREVLKAAYGAATAPLKTTVSYRVRRGGLAIPTPPDPGKSTMIEVDFSYIGPVRPDPDPSWPDPVNPNLAPCSVFAQGSSTPNELLKAHNGMDATLQFDLYTPAVDGQLVEFYWDGTHVVEADYTVDTSDPSPIEVTIPWNYINEAGNAPALPVHYAIRANDSSNAQHAPATEVKVEAVIVVAPKPEFLGLNPAGRLVCSSLEDPDNPSADPAFRLQVPDLSKFGLQAGAEITLTWQPYWGESGDTPLPKENVKEEIVKIDADHPVTGFIWRIEPYDKHILPIYDDVGGRPRGRGRVSFSFDYKGDPVSSDPFDTVVNIAGPSGTCPV